MDTRVITLERLQNGLIINADTGETLGFYKCGSGELHLTRVPGAITVTDEEQALSVAGVNVAFPESERRLIERPLSSKTVFN